MHIKEDAAASLQVLCDSCAPGAPHEDPHDREQLRNLVFDFLTNSGSFGMRDARVAMDEAAERILIDGLCKVCTYTLMLFVDISKLL